MENIIKSLRAAYPVSDASLDLLKSKLKKEIFPKKHLIISGDQINRNVYFIEQGITRSYCITNGVEVTTWFSKEGDITFGLLDLYANMPSFEYVETLEETVVYSILISDLNQLYKTNIDIANWSRVIHQECVLMLQLIRIDSLFLTAREKHEKLLQRIPDIYQRVNLSYIASFLGISNSTLSRIRRN